MENTNNHGMKWYNFLVYLWLPLNIFVNLLLTIFAGIVSFPIIKGLILHEITATAAENADYFLLMYLLLYVCILPLFVSIAAKRRLKKFRQNPQKMLGFWYILPAVVGVGIVPILLFKQVELHPVLIGAILVLIIRALVMVPANNFYFYKRSELFVEKSRRASKKEKEEAESLEEAAQLSEEEEQALEQDLQYCEECCQCPEAFGGYCDECAQYSEEDAGVEEVEEESAEVSEEVAEVAEIAEKVAEVEEVAKEAPKAAPKKSTTSTRRYKKTPSQIFRSTAKKMFLLDKNGSFPL